MVINRAGIEGMEDVLKWSYPIVFCPANRDVLSMLKEQMEQSNKQNHVYLWPVIPRKQRVPRKLKKKLSGGAKGQSLRRYVKRLVKTNKFDTDYGALSSWRVIQILVPIPSDTSKLFEEIDMDVQAIFNAMGVPRLNQKI